MNHRRHRDVRYSTSSSLNRPKRLQTTRHVVTRLTHFRLNGKAPTHHDVGLPIALFVCAENLQLNMEQLFRVIQRSVADYQGPVTVCRTQTFADWAAMGFFVIAHVGFRLWLFCTLLQLHTLNLKHVGCLADLLDAAVHTVKTTGPSLNVSLSVPLEFCLSVSWILNTFLGLPHVIRSSKTHCNATCEHGPTKIEVDKRLLGSRYDHRTKLL